MKKALKIFGLKTFRRRDSFDLTCFRTGLETTHSDIHGIWLYCYSNFYAKWMLYK